MLFNMVICLLVIGFLDNKDYIKYIPVCSKCGEPIPKDESIYVIENLYESDSSYKCKD